MGESLYSNSPKNKERFQTHLHIKSNLLTEYHMSFVRHLQLSNLEVFQGFKKQHMSLLMSN